MIQYLEIIRGEALIKLCFTRMSEDDDWVCQLPNETLTDIQDILNGDYHE
jgi:hypothetical protein